MRSLVFLFATLLATLLPAQTSADFDAGVAAYEQGDYAAAIAAFTADLTTGETAATRHNLALAHYQMGQPAEAVWQLERALRLAPYDENYHFKRALLRQQLGLPANEPDRWQLFSRFLSPAQWQIAATLAFWVLIAALCLPRCAGRPAGWFAKSLRLGGTLVLLLVATALYLTRDDARSGVYLGNQPAELRAAPAAAAPQTGIARPGERALRLDQHRAYVKVRTEGGAEGWLPEAGFRLL